MNSTIGTKTSALRVDRAASRPINRNKRMKIEKVQHRLELNGGSRTCDVTAVVGTDPDGNVTRCVCGFVHDDGYMICCDQCAVWQHIECVGISPSRVPDKYLCDFCDPRPLDNERAVKLQRQKLESMASSDSDSDAATAAGGDTAASSPPDFSNALCEGVIHDHLTSTRLSNLSLNGSGVQAKKRVRKVSENKVDHVREQEQQQPRHTITTISTDMPHIVQASPRTMPKQDEANDAFEHAGTNEYSSAVSQCVEQFLQDVNQPRPPQPRAVNNLCSVKRVGSNKKGLFLNQAVAQDTFLIECIGCFVGTFELSEKTPFPFGLFFFFAEKSICVDARKRGNIARYVRRSCKPNSKISHFFANSQLHVGIYASLSLEKDTEITIPFDFQYENCHFPVECPCQSSACLIAGATKDGDLNNVRRLRLPREEEVAKEAFESQIPLSSATKKLNSSWSCVRPGQKRKRRKVTTDEVMVMSKKDGDGDSDEKETANHVDGSEPEKKKILSREERKIEAIMKAFERMEKNQKRKRPESQPIKSGGASPPDTDDRKGDKSYRGRRASIFGKRKPGRRRQRGASGPAGTSDCLSPDSNSNLTATPPLTPQIDVVSPFVTTPLSATATATPSLSRLPQKKRLLKEWREYQERVRWPLLRTTFEGILSAKREAEPRLPSKIASPPPSLPVSPVKPKSTSALYGKKRWLQMAQNSTLSSSPDGTLAPPPPPPPSEPPPPRINPSPPPPPPPPPPSKEERGEKEAPSKGVKKKVSLLEYRNRKKETPTKPENPSPPCNNVYSAFGLTYEEPKFSAATSRLDFKETNHVKEENDDAAATTTPLIEPVTPDGDGSHASRQEVVSPTREADVLDQNQSEEGGESSRTVDRASVELEAAKTENDVFPLPGALSDGWKKSPMTARTFLLPPSTQSGDLGPGPGSNGPFCNQ